MSRASLSILAILAGAAVATVRGCSSGETLIDAPGLKVLVVEETEVRGTLPPTQQAIFTSTDVRRLIDSKGGELLIVDPSTPQPIAPEWIKPLGRPASLPWVVVAQDGRGVEGPLPASVDDFVEAIERVVK